MKRLIYTFVSLLACVALYGQVKKPTLMVVPADNWCVNNQYMDEFDDQGNTLFVPNYKKALQTS